jgi:hypothetical protein
MQFTLRLILALILFCGALPTQAEDYSGIRFGLKVPYSYSGNYYIRLADRWGAYGGVQFNTFPFGGAPVTYLQVFSSNEKDALAEVLREPFSIGAGFDVGAHYYMGADNRRYYIAASLQWTNLLKRDISDDVVEAAFVVELDDYPLGPILEQDSKKPLTLNTHYLNLGLAGGVRFLLPYNPDWEVAMELEVQKTLASHHFLFSDYRYLTPVAEQASKELKALMRKSGWFPTINVYFLYKFG